MEGLWKQVFWHDPELIINYGFYSVLLIENGKTLDLLLPMQFLDSEWFGAASDDFFQVNPVRLFHGIEYTLLSPLHF